jgi:hypothetical protein
MNNLELAVRQPLMLIAGGREYTIEFPLPAVIAAEEKLGRSLKTPADWLCAPAKDIPSLLAAGLMKHHPDVTAEDIAIICDDLGPEACTEFTEALGAVAFPRFLARYKENLEKIQKRAAEGKPSPKALSADAL